MAVKAYIDNDQIVRVTLTKEADGDPATGATVTAEVFDAINGDSISESESLSEEGVTGVYEGDLPDYEAAEDVLAYLRINWTWEGKSERAWIELWGVHRVIRESC